MPSKSVKEPKGKKSDPQTMEELLAATGYQPKGFKRGETIKGKVVEITGRAVYVDIGGKAEAVVSEHEYELARDYYRALKPGDEVTGVVLVSENEMGQVVLSLRRAAVESKWKMFDLAMQEETTIEVRGREVTKGGLLVDADGIYGFVPTSQVGHGIEGGLGSLVGKTIAVKVIEVDRLQNRLVLSERAVSEAAEMEKRRETLSIVEIGKEYEGKVVGMVPFGVFVEIDVSGKAAKRGEEEGVKEDQSADYADYAD